MPNIYIPFSGTGEVISRPVALSIFSDVQKDFSLPKDRQIIFNEKLNYATSMVSTIEAKQQYNRFLQERLATLPSSSCYSLSLDEIYDQGNVNQSGPNQHHPLIYNDVASGVKFRLVSVYVQAELKIIIVSTSLQELKKIIGIAMVKLSMGRDLFQHSITYSPILPKGSLAILREAYRALTGAQQVDLEGIFNHIKDNVAPEFTMLSDTSGGSSNLALTITQGSAFGMLKDNAMLEPVEREDDKSQYAIEIPYTFYYDKPVGIMAYYPIIINNRLLPEKLCNLTRQVEQPQVTNRGSAFEVMASFLEIPNQLFADKQRDHMLRFPDYDNIVLSNPLSYHTYPLQVLLQLEDDKQHCVNLSELDELEIDPLYLDFILNSEAEFISTPYASIFHIALSINETVQRNHLTVDSVGNVKSKVVLELIKRHRLHLGLLLRIDMLTREAWVRLFKYPKVIERLIDDINVLIDHLTNGKALAGKQRLTPEDFYRYKPGYSRDRWSDGVRRHPLDPGYDWDKPSYGDGKNISRKTIVTTGIIAKRK